jgi:hypothetical protein
MDWKKASSLAFAAALCAGTASAAGGHPMLEAVNAGLALQGAGYRVEIGEYVTVGDVQGAGTTVFANNRGNKQLALDFVPGDPRRGGFTDIAWLIDNQGATSHPASSLTAAQTSAAIRSAMGTWQDVECSEIPLSDLGNVALDLGVVQNVLGFGGNGALFTDLMHAGWLPAGFFDLIAQNGSTFILGVTFTFNWIDGAGNPTDIDNNGKADVAFREIYYNNAFPWRVNGGNIDVESVALHEAGHGLSQQHFGKIFGTNANGQLHFAPLAVMNAAYSQVQHELTGSDVAGHCSNWAAWPNN